MYYELTDSFIVSADADTTWAFFADARNLPAITPPWLAFRNLVTDPRVHDGATLNYTIRWAGIPIRWRTRIIDFTPPRQFIDLQVRGPYTLWHHQHIFTPHEKGTLCRDRVIYKLPFGPLGRPAHTLFVRRQLIAIFAYRRQILGQRLNLVQTLQDITIARLGASPATE